MLKPRLKSTEDSRSRATRKMLLDTAMGFMDPTAPRDMTARGVAEAAGVNHALVNYHFGGIDGLCRAVLNNCAEALELCIAPIITDFRKDLETCPQEALHEVGHQYFRALIIALAGDEARRFIALLTRRNSCNISAYDMMQDKILQPMHGVLAAFAAKARGIDYSSLEAATLGQLALAQLMAFFRGGGAVCKHMGWSSFPPEMYDSQDDIITNSLLRSMGLYDAPARNNKTATRRAASA